MTTEATWVALNGSTFWGRLRELIGKANIGQAYWVVMEADYCAHERQVSSVLQNSRASPQTRWPI